MNKPAFIPVAAVYDRRNPSEIGTAVIRRSSFWKVAASVSEWMTAVIDRRYSCRPGIWKVATSVSEWMLDGPLAHARGYGIAGERIQPRYANPILLHG
jgi:hypothetical protein